MSETTTALRQYLREDFEIEFDRRVNGGERTSMRRKAAQLGLPPASLGHMTAGNRPINRSLVLSLGRLLPGANLDETFFVDRPAVLSGRALPRKTVTAKAA